MTRTSAAVLGLAAALCCAIAVMLASRDLGSPGLYYDEVIQANPALEFLKQDGRPSEVPGIRSVRWLGGWFPWMTQPYMGALKSQLLVPVFAILGPSPEVLRGTTLLWAVIGIALVMVWSHAVFGYPTALFTGLLLATDPSVLFVARHDWGSFSLGLLLRGAALGLLFGAGRSRSLVGLLLGGACLGLGVYNKIDFAVFVAAAGIALLGTSPGWIRSAFTDRRREVACVLAGFAAGALPMVIGAAEALAVAGAASAAQGFGADWGEKLSVARAVLDGSYFHRLMLTGGSFENLFRVEGAVASPTLAILALAAIVLTVFAWRDRRGAAPGAPPAATRFVLATTFLTLLGILLTPRAVRIHHYLNVVPFPQLVIGLAAAEIVRRGSGRGRAAARIAALGMVGLVLAGNLRVDLAVGETIRDGGRGRWSDALARFEQELPRTTRVVSLDWGFDGPLRFLAPERPAAEPIWRMRRPDPRRGLRIGGDADDIYLFYEAAYAVFPYGQALLETIARLPADAVRVGSHRDRVGRPVFKSVRFSGPHELVYRGGRFEVKLR